MSALRPIESIPIATNRLDRFENHRLITMKGCHKDNNRLFFFNSDFIESADGQTMRSENNNDKLFMGFMVNASRLSPSFWVEERLYLCPNSRRSLLVSDGWLIGRWFVSNFREVDETNFNFKFSVMSVGKFWLIRNADFVHILWNEFRYAIDHISLSHRFIFRNWI